MTPQVLDLIGSQEACRILGVHASTLSRYVANGRIERAMKVLPARNGTALFHRADIEALRDERAATTNPHAA